MKLLIVCCTQQQFPQGKRWEKEKNVQPHCSVDYLLKINKMTATLKASHWQIVPHCRLFLLDCFFRAFMILYCWHVLWGILGQWQWCLALIFLYLFISFPSPLPMAIFYLTHLFILPSSSHYTFFVLLSHFPAPASFIIFHLFTFSLSLTQSCSLRCAPRLAFALNLWKCMRHASPYCYTGKNKK